MNPETKLNTAESARKQRGYLDQDPECIEILLPTPGMGTLAKFGATCLEFGSVYHCFAAPEGIWITDESCIGDYWPDDDGKTIAFEGELYPHYNAWHEIETWLAQVGIEHLEELIDERGLTWYDCDRGLRARNK